MLKKIVFTALFTIVSLYGTAQKDINNYKYILIPKKFNFSKSEDQYQLNSLTKFLFNKYGFKAYFNDDTFPEDLQKDRCLALTSELSKDESGMFKTKLKFTLKDCFGSVITASETGESRLKDYKKAYTEALRDAFETFKNTEYEYVETETVEIDKDDVEIIKEKPAEVANADEVMKKTEKKIVENVSEHEIVDTKSIYYAQAISNGFQLVDSKPEIVMVILATAAEGVFIVKDKSAIVFKKEGKWMYSENNGTSKILKELDIKF